MIPASFRSLVAIVVATAAVLGAAGWTVAALTGRRQLPLDVVDIQSPETLAVKLGALRNFPGLKIVLLGDSVVAGRALEKSGDPEWRQHGLANMLADRLRTALPGRDIVVLNLAMDGALPTDIDSLVAAIPPGDVDLFVFDLGLRSFSRDFSTPDEHRSRPWLTHLAAQASIDPATQLARATFWAEQIGQRLSSAGSSMLPLCRYSDFLQRRFLGSPPREAIMQLRDTLSAPSRAGSATPDDPLDEQLSLMLKLKRRFSTIDLQPDNVQVAALRNLLARLAAGKPAAIAFYAQENPQQISDLLSAKEYRQLRGALDAVVRPYESPGHVQYLGSIAGLQPSDYLDMTHVTRRGHELMADQLATAIVALLARPTAKAAAEQN